MIATKKIIQLLLVLMSAIGGIKAQILTLSPAYHAMGLKVSIPANFDQDSTAHAFVQYKKSTESTWRDGFELDRIVASNVDQFRGSLFLLEPGTAYDVVLTIRDSFPTIQTTVLPQQSVSTLDLPTFTASATVKWVSPTGSGTTYSFAQPGNLKTLLSSGTVGCGTTVMLKDGVYTDYDMGISINSNCTENTPISFLAAPGATPIFDGGYSSPLVWTPQASDSNLYATALPAGTDYTNLCLINGRLLYPYPSLVATPFLGDYNLIDLNFEADGFVRNDNAIWIKTQDHLNPNQCNVTISKAFRWLTVYGNNHNAHLKFKGITIKNIGRSSVSPNGVYGATALDLRSLHHVIFDDCHFEYNESDISFSNQCDHLLIQNSSFLNGNGLFTHAMVKKSVDTYLGEPASYGRFKETSAISVLDNRNVVLRNNHFEGSGSGIAGGFSSGFVEEADVYGNVFLNCGDAVECDGFWVNARVWGNEIISPGSAFSMAPPKLGPRYFYRNTIHHLKGHNNEVDDPYFIGCAPVTVYWLAGIGVKTNSGPVSGREGNIYLINNTFHSEDTLGFAFTIWDAEWREATYINNIFYHGSEEVGYFHDLGNKPDFQLNLQRNNFYSDDPTSPLLVAKPIHGQYSCTDLPDVQLFESTLRQISGSNDIYVRNSLNVAPGFVSMTNGGFELDSLSPMVNQGQIVPGFYDYMGNSPDLGAKESPYPIIGVQAPSPSLSLRLFPNPGQDEVRVDWGRTLTDVTIEVLNAQGQLVDTRHIESGTHFILKASLPAGIYWIGVQTAEGRGAQKWVSLGAAN